TPQDWFLLDSHLRICYTSPSFNKAVDQSDQIIGRSFLDYLYNPSGEILGQRLFASLADDDGQAAIITISYARLPIIRHHLSTGHFIQDPPNYSFTQYHLVVHKAAGFLLVFLHDKAQFPRDCDFHLYESLKLGDFSNVVHYIPPLNPNPPYHMFQILLNDDRRPIIFSTNTTIAGRLTIVPAHLAAGTQNLQNMANNRCQTSCSVLLVMYRLLPCAMSHLSQFTIQSSHVGSIEEPIPHDGHVDSRDEHIRSLRLAVTTKVAQMSLEEWQREANRL
ncbi:hypothetical protein PIIN_10921, partial [Serendipita indica DSM 11827]